MSDMDQLWTTQTPTEPGYYWLRDAEGDIGIGERIEAVVVEIGVSFWIEGLFAFFPGDDTAVDLPDLTAVEWSGPIVPPK